MRRGRFCGRARRTRRDSCPAPCTGSPPSRRWTACAGRTSFSPIRARTIARCRRRYGCARGARGRPPRRTCAPRSPARATGAGRFASVSRRRSFMTAPAAAISRAGLPIWIATASRSSSTTSSRAWTRWRSAIKQRADCFVSFGGTRARPSIVAPAIRADELDVLVYPELGMDACSFGLAALRLAPRQYAGWGHPVTTGQTMIDAFISCAAMEPAQAQQHYTEHLIRLPGIGTRYERLALADRRGAGRASGFPEDRVLLLCPQSLWKIHPDNDALFAEVLAANRDALLLLFQRPASRGHRPVHAPPRAQLRAAWPRSARAGARPAAGGARRLPAHQSRLRRDARHAALVGRQHEPRCARLRTADRDPARSIHARPAERGDARAARPARVDRTRPRRLSGHRGAA